MATFIDMSKPALLFLVEEVFHDLQRLSREKGLDAVPDDGPQLSDETREVERRLKLALVDTALTTADFRELVTAEFAEVDPAELAELDRRLSLFDQVKTYVPLDAVSPEDARPHVVSGLRRRHELEQALR